MIFYHSCLISRSDCSLLSSHNGWCQFPKKTTQAYCLPKANLFYMKWVRKISFELVMATVDVNQLTIELIIICTIN